jgi:hypothetical protein
MPNFYLLNVTIHLPLLFKPPPHKYVSSKAILNCLDVTASWLSRAKQVVKLLEEIGPDRSSPDPLVIKRLQSKAVINKGSDLLTFLKRQVRVSKELRCAVKSPSNFSSLSLTLTVFSSLLSSSLDRVRFFQPSLQYIGYLYSHPALLDLSVASIYKF